MKNFKRVLINSSIGIAATVLSISSSFGQKHIKKNYDKNGLEISIGQQSWNDEDLRENYKGIFLVDLGYSRKFTRGIEGGISLEFGSLKTIEDRNVVFGRKVMGDPLKYTSINLGLGAVILKSKDKKTNLFLKGEVRKTFIYEEGLMFEEYKRSSLDYDKEKSALGYSVGGGIEKMFGGAVSGFLEINVRKVGIPIYNLDLEFGGIKLGLGLRYNL